MPQRALDRHHRVGAGFEFIDRFAHVLGRLLPAHRVRVRVHPHDAQRRKGFVEDLALLDRFRLPFFPRRDVELERALRVSDQLLSAHLEQQRLVHVLGQHLAARPEGVGILGAVDQTLRVGRHDLDEIRLHERIVVARVDPVEFSAVDHRGERRHPQVARRLGEVREAVGPRQTRQNRLGHVLGGDDAACVRGFPGRVAQGPPRRERLRRILGVFQSRDLVVRRARDRVEFRRVVFQKRLHERLAPARQRVGAPDLREIVLAVRHLDPGARGLPARMNLVGVPAPHAAFRSVVVHLLQEAAERLDQGLRLWMVRHLARIQALAREREHILVAAREIQDVLQAVQPDAPLLVARVEVRLRAHLAARFLVRPARDRHDVRVARVLHRRLGAEQLVADGGDQTPRAPARGVVQRHVFLHLLDRRLARRALFYRALREGAQDELRLREVADFRLDQMEQATERVGDPLEEAPRLRADLEKPRLMELVHVRRRFRRV